MSKLESLAGERRPSKLGNGDPYENDLYEEAEQAFNLYMEMAEPPIESQELYMSENQVNTSFIYSVKYT